MGATGYQVNQRVRRYVRQTARMGVGKKQRFLDSPAAVAGALASIGSYTPGHVWTCQQASGNLVNTAGSGTLTATSTVAGQFRQPSPYSGRHALLLMDASGGYFIDPDTDVGNPGTGSVAFVGIARLGAYGATRTWASRLSGTNVGWFVQKYEGGIYLYVDDGAGGGAGINHFHTPMLNTAQWCAYGFGYDTVADQAWVAISSGVSSLVTRSDISTLTPAGGTGRHTIGAATNRTEQDLVWCASFTGANANWYGNETKILDALLGG